MTIKNVTIAGAGTLGSQITYQSALKGMRVTVWNRHVESAKTRLHALKDAYHRDLKLSEADFNAGMANIVAVTTDLREAVEDADLVIEAVPEAMEVKEAFYEELKAVVPDKTIVASNSSTFMPSQLVKFFGDPRRFLHIHFANEIWKYNVVEIVSNPDTKPELVEEVIDFAKAIGMVPIHLYKEQPGYVLNSLLIPFLDAAMALWVNGIASPHEIDKDWMISTGSPSGPFIILDTVGLRTAYQISLNKHQATGDEMAKQVADKLKEMIDTGHYGREAGQGFYHYPDAEFLAPDFLK
ncbi:3-hydroxyacyl-CoA dehydrogenase [Limosilactobacillus fermentum]|nr:3-hydroxyacyl-CoA dehydrogenase [Limosilactobacillus fermentum]MCT3441863.1 3-hydroxyacyl-CoA dehydrogenase [Limosilactobacillus fermentum]